SLLYRLYHLDRRRTLPFPSELRDHHLYHRLDLRALDPLLTLRPDALRGRKNPSLRSISLPESTKQSNSYPGLLPEGRKTAETHRDLLKCMISKRVRCPQSWVAYLVAHLRLDLHQNYHRALVAHLEMTCQFVVQAKEVRQIQAWDRRTSKATYWS
ncbi:MAG: hypothetical protein LQ349_006856, partial [Xanthoria aureola]